MIPQHEESPSKPAIAVLVCGTLLIPFGWYFQIHGKIWFMYLRDYFYNPHADYLYDSYSYAARVYFVDCLDYIHNHAWPIGAMIQSLGACIAAGALTSLLVQKKTAD